jgi:hypothetical protein
MELDHDDWPQMEMLQLDAARLEEALLGRDQAWAPRQSHPSVMSSTTR